MFFIFILLMLLFAVFYDLRRYVEYMPEALITLLPSKVYSTSDPVFSPLSVKPVSSKTSSAHQNFHVTIFLRTTATPA